MDARMATMISGLGAVLDDSWDAILEGALGSTLRVYSQRLSGIVPAGLVAAGSYLTQWDGAGRIPLGLLQVGTRHLNSACK